MIGKVTIKLIIRLLSIRFLPTVDGYVINPSLYICIFTLPKQIHQLLIGLDGMDDGGTRTDLLLLYEGQRIDFPRRRKTNATKEDIHTHSCNLQDKCSSSIDYLIESLISL